MTRGFICMPSTHRICLLQRQGLLLNLRFILLSVTRNDSKRQDQQQIFSRKLPGTRSPVSGAIADTIPNVTPFIRAQSAPSRPQHLFSGVGPFLLVAHQAHQLPAWSSACDFSVAV